MKEVWKDVVGYEGLYEVSNCGGIRIVRAGSPYYMKLVSCLKSNKGYYTVMMLDRNGKRKRRSIHRMVAEAYGKQHMALSGVMPIKHKTGKSIIALWRKPSKKSESGAE